MMNCPHCQSSILVERSFRNGVQVVVCRQCRGIWLDAGQLSQLAEDPKSVKRCLEHLLWTSERAARLCPNCDVAMYQGKLPDTQNPLDYCAECDGLWFDSSELNATLRFLVSQAKGEIAAACAGDGLTAARRERQRPNKTRRRRTRRRVKRGLRALFQNPDTGGLSVVRVTTWSLILTVAVASSVVAFIAIPLVRGLVCLAPFVAATVTAAYWIFRLFQMDGDGQRDTRPYSILDEWFDGGGDGG